MPKQQLVVAYPDNRIGGVMDRGPIPLWIILVVPTAALGLFGIVLLTAGLTFYWGTG